MKKFSQSLLLILLSSSLLMRAAVPEDFVEKTVPVVGALAELEEAINQGDFPKVRTLVEAGVDLNEGLGFDRKPSLVLAIENLGTELKEHPKDVAWYLIATAFGSVALYGVYELMFRTVEAKGAVTTAEIMVSLQQSSPQVPSQQAPVVPPTPEFPGVPEGSGLGDQTRPEIAPSIAPTPPVQQIPAKLITPAKITTAATITTKRPLLEILKNLFVGTTGGIGALKLGRPSTSPRTHLAEERLKIVKFIAQQERTNIFAADNSGENALDKVITYLSAYQPGSECYSCMEEAKKSITDRSIRAVYELYSDLSKNLDLTTSCPAECLCKEGGECLCGDCSCSASQK